MSLGSRLWWAGVALGSLGVGSAYGFSAGLCLAGAGFAVAAVVVYVDSSERRR